MLLNDEQIRDYAHSLAESHVLSTQRTAGILLRSLNMSVDTLMKTREQLTNTVAEDPYFMPAEEWLLDNFYLLEEQISIIKRHLAKRYEKNLPQLTDHLPRVYDIARQIIIHGDGRCPIEKLAVFIEAYQEIIPLTLGELWSLPTMLRLAII
jgi:cyclic beta-1,2-glucan synthetase